MNYEADGKYSSIHIYDGTYLDRPTRFLKLDGSSSAAVFLDGSELVYAYTKFAEYLPRLIPEARRALVIGGGAYTIPRRILADFPYIEVDVAEIEPDLHELAMEHFGLPRTDRLHNYVMDGRQAMIGHGPYDLIFIDAYTGSVEIPSQFTTAAFFEEVRRNLAPGGIVMANVIGILSGRPPSFLMDEIRTFSGALPFHEFFAMVNPRATIGQNIVFVGSESTLAMPDAVAAQRIEIERYDLSLHRVINERLMMEPDNERYQESA